MNGAHSNSRPDGRMVSPLARWIGRAPVTDVELRALRRRAWRETGVVVIRPEEVDDAFARQALINAAQALFGPRVPAPDPIPPRNRKEEP